MAVVTAVSPLFRPIPPAASGVPLYRVVKQALLQAIDAGHCAPGATLPRESDLAGAFGVSIGTLRKAVDELAAEHIVVRRQGRGTFVATHDARRLLLRFFPLERADGLREAPAVEVVSFERGRAQDEAAQALGLQAGEPVIQVETRLSLQGRPVVHERLTLPGPLFKGLTERRLRDRADSLYELYQSDFGITVVCAQERARVATADRAAVRALGVSAGAPVLQVRRRTLTFGERPVEHRLSVIDTAHHDYVQLLSGPT